MGANRSERVAGREAALLYLFGLDFDAGAWPGGFPEFWKSDPLKTAGESLEEGEEFAFSPSGGGPARGGGARDYAERLAGAVLQDREALDALIRRAVDKWAPDRVGRVEWIILRIGLCEMRSMPDVPPQVAINEAVNLAKRFGAAESSRFVNGVLDRIRIALPEWERESDGEVPPEVPESSGND
ncbi:MAG TPA: transcription antitermination factor NusB [Candidatus Hydrogenedentes bacterium]|nr:transcription antitermination factor NusB [Candidatus Hydrogenedentota bacterium]